MKIKIDSDRSFEFYFPDVDTRLRVDDSPDNVLIRATRNTFSDRRKTRFLHHLAAEGFIPDRYQWVTSVESQWSQVCWRVERSWVSIPEGHSVRTRRFMIRLLISGAILWLGLMAAVLMHWI